MQEEKYTSLIAKFLSGNMTPEEEHDFLDRKDDPNQDASLFDDAKEIWGLAKEPDFSFESGKNEAWANIEQAIEAEAPLKISYRKKSVFNRWLAIAATILLLVAAGWWATQEQLADAQPVVVHTLVDEKKQVELPDGSVVWLNENSVFSYDKSFASRTVELSGEAFFDIVPDANRPFQILSGETTTTVLGTSFNVRAYPEEKQVEVTVETGVVELATEAKQAPRKIVLTQNQSGLYDEVTKEMDVLDEKLTNATAWRIGKLEYSNTSLLTVKRDLERYFDIEIEVKNPAILNCKLNFNQLTESPVLEDINGTITYILNIAIEEKNGVYIWNGAGCK